MVRIPDPARVEFNCVTFVTTWDHGTSFDQSCHQVNLDCLRDGVGVDRGQALWNCQSSITYLSK